LQIAASDRRLAKSHVSMHMGGAATAIDHDRDNPTPNRVIVGTSLPRTAMIAELAAGRSG
jgi:pilus assembly protein CpaE